MANSNATPATSTTRPSSPKYLQHQINTTAELRPLKALNHGGATGRALSPNLIPLKSMLAVHVRLLGFDISHTGEATLSTARPECMPAVSAQVPTYRKHAISSAAAQSSRRLGESYDVLTGRQAIGSTPAPTTHLAFCSSLLQLGGDSSLQLGVDIGRSGGEPKTEQTPSPSKTGGLHGRNTACRTLHALQPEIFPQVRSLAAAVPSVTFFACTRYVSSSTISTFAGSATVRSDGANETPWFERQHTQHAMGESQRGPGLCKTDGAMKARGDTWRTDACRAGATLLALRCVIPCGQDLLSTIQTTRPPVGNPRRTACPVVQTVVPVSRPRISAAANILPRVSSYVSVKAPCNRGSSEDGKDISLEHSDGDILPASSVCLSARRI